MDKNPFSLYDFLGYLVPGILCLFITYKACTLPLDLSQWTLKTFFELPFAMDVPMVFILVICCYTLGHIISYFSSITIEHYANKQYGYPTSYLLGDIDRGESMFKINFNITENYSILQILNISICRIILLFLLAPFAFVDLFLGFVVGLRKFFIKPLDDQQIIWVYEKISSLQRFLMITETISSNEEGYDIHRVIHHYIYETVGKQSVKFDNYVALYGFLRSVSICILIFYLIICLRFNGLCVLAWLILICSILLVYTLFSYIGSLVNNYRIRENSIYLDILQVIEFISVIGTIQVCLMYIFFKEIKMFPDFTFLELLSQFIFSDFMILTVFSLALTYISFMAFMKFYRRYTLLAFMCLISDVNLRNQNN